MIRYHICFNMFYKENILKFKKKFSKYKLFSFFFVSSAQQNMLNIWRIEWKKPPSASSMGMHSYNYTRESSWHWPVYLKQINIVCRQAFKALFNTFFDIGSINTHHFCVVPKKSRTLWITSNFGGQNYLKTQKRKGKAHLSVKPFKYVMTQWGTFTLM